MSADKPASGASHADKGEVVTDHMNAVIAAWERDRLSLRRFAQHIEWLERSAHGTTYPIWKRPLRRYRLHLIGPQGRIESDHFGTLRTKREAEQAAAEWNAQPLRDGYRVEVHRGR